jgi:thiamine-phosphate pyrophosphorylase
MESLTLEMVRLAKNTRTRVVVNDRLDVALACGATGVHLRADSVSANAVRSIAPQGFLVGRSVHSLAEARVLGDGVDYLVAGTVWETSSKSPGHPTLGLEGLAEIVRLANVPVIGIGGVTLDRLEALAGTRAGGAAAIGMFMGPDPGREGACRAVPLSSLIAEARARFDRVELT